jgi:hypothetical protein
MSGKKDQSKSMSGQSTIVDEMSNSLVPRGVRRVVSMASVKEMFSQPEEEGYLYFIRGKRIISHSVVPYLVGQRGGLLADLLKEIVMKEK